MSDYVMLTSCSVFDKRPRGSQAARQVPVRVPEAIARISRLVNRAADTFAEISRERLPPQRRLKQIAEITALLSRPIEA